MEPILKGLAIYFFLLIVFRISGKRTLSQATNFDLVLLLIISETTQQAMVDNDRSLTTGFLLIVTLIGTALLLSIIKQQFPVVERWIDGLPLVLKQEEKLFKDRMDKEKVDEPDILQAARSSQGLSKMDEIKYAVLENSGKITIVPNDKK